jgi:predicted permease
MAGDAIPRAGSIRPDASVVLFTVGLTLVTGLVFGLVPALRSASGASAPKLREGGRGGTAGQERQRARSALVMIESALAVILLVGAGLMIKSFYRLTQVDAGFAAESTVRINIRVPHEIFEDREAMIPRMSAYMQRLFEGLQNVPGVLSVGASKTAPLQGGAEPYPFALPGGLNQDVLRKVGAYIITPGFFQSLGIPMIRGRDFTWNETQAGLIVSQSLASKLWPNEDAIGKQLLIDTRAIEVIGVAGDVKNEGLAEEQTSAVYVSMFSSPRGNQNLFVRVRGNPATIMPALREAVWSADPNQAIRTIQTMQSLKSETIARPQFFMTLIAVFGALALTLAAVGMYGVISYTIRQRTAEIGVRMALGADAMQVYKLVVGKAMQMALVGVGAGIIGALLLTQLMRTLLFGVAPTDLFSLIGAALVLTLTAFLAAFLPARRAARIAPSVAFRSE